MEQFLQQLASGLANGAVGVTCIDGDDPDFSARGADMPCVNEERRSFDAIGGEGRCRRRGCVGNDQREVGAAALLESGFGGTEAESAGYHKLRKVAHQSEK